MMDAISIDTFAATNPAFCSLVLRAFAEGYIEGDSDGVPLPLILLPLPLVLSAEITETLRATKVTTGLLSWVGKNPEVTVGLAERVTKTAPFSRQALLFGLRYRIVSLTLAGRVVPESVGLARKPNFPATAEPGRAIALGRRLGIWAGQMRSQETVFVSLGVNR